MASTMYDYMEIHRYTIVTVMPVIYRYMCLYSTAFVKASVDSLRKNSSLEIGAGVARERKVVMMMDDGWMMVDDG